MNKRLCLFLSLAGLLGVSHANSSDEVTLLYVEHPAFHSDKQHDGNIEGLIANPVKQAFLQAGVTYKWQEIPVARQYQILQDSQESACIVGAVKIAEREKVGQFSHPIYQSRPIIALSRADNQAMTDGGKLEDTLRNPKLVMLAKQGYSFGKFVDDSIARFKPKTEPTSAGMPSMMNMLLYKRADYFFMAEDAFGPLTSSPGYEPAQFKLSHFSDMPAGNMRYLWCTRKVPEATLKKLNIELDKLFRKG
ncbi:transporter substrate-binding domain-containing protein [Undibacterium terreum]|nr:transporter substrate-binding domain-containing protein [Undibacterium terreum]